MTRKEIIDSFPEECEEQTINIIDYFEGKFIDIIDKLSINSLSDLAEIESAYNIAKLTAAELY